MNIFSARLAFDDAVPEPLERHGSTTRAGGGCTMKTSLKINHWGGGSARRGSPSGFAAPALHNLRGYSGRSPATMPLAIWSASVPHCVGRAPTLHHDGGRDTMDLRGAGPMQPLSSKSVGFYISCASAPHSQEGLARTPRRIWKTCAARKARAVGAVTSSAVLRACVCSDVHAALCLQRCAWSD